MSATLLTQTLQFLLQVTLCNQPTAVFTESDIGQEPSNHTARI